MTKPSTRKGKTNGDLPQRRSDRVLRDVLKIAARILEERAELGDGEELAGAVLELDELIRLERAPVPRRWRA